LQNLLVLSYASTSAINFHDFESFIKIDKMDSSFAFMDLQIILILHQYRLSNIFYLLESQELGDWAQARSTTWYSQFLVTQCDD
jgi:hypothetical protein